MTNHETVNKTPRSQQELAMRVQNIIDQDRSASSIETREANWVWYPYIPAGALTIVEGDPGVGKSTLVYSLAADLSAGRALPGDVARDPMRILLLTREDTPEHTIVPRLRLHNANLDNITINTSKMEFDEAGLLYIQNRLISAKYSVIVMDPVTTYAGSRRDMNASTQTRAFSDPLSEIAQRTDCALIIVRHMRKASTQDTNRKYRGAGSMDILGSSRSTLSVDDMGGIDREMAQVKENWGPKGPPLAFKLDNQRVVWGGLATPRKVCKEPRSTVLARKFLLTLLATGPVRAAEVMEKGAANGHTARAIRAGAEGVAEHYQTADGHWYALLPLGAVVDNPVFDNTTAGLGLNAKGQTYLRSKQNAPA